MSEEALKIAGKIFSVNPKYLHPELKATLEWVSEITEKAGGTLKSRQLVAYIVFEWQQRNSTSNAIPTSLEGNNGEKTA